MPAILIVLIALVLLVVLILKFKIHPFIALTLAGFLIALMAGLSPIESINLYIEGFGRMAGNIAIVIGLAVIIGQLLAESRGAEKIARVFLNITGEEKAPLAMVGSGSILSIPVFSDTSYYLLIPIAKALAYTAKRSFIAIVIALSAGTLATHVFVPPTPGPLVMAENLNVDLGLVMLIGIIVAIPTAILVGWFFGKWVSKRIDIPAERYMSGVAGAEMKEIQKKEMPSLLSALLPIVIPVILIAGNTITNVFVSEGAFVNFMGFVGTPAVALFIAAVVAYLFLGKFRGMTFDNLRNVMQKSLEVGGVVILITAAGGAMGQVLIATGVGGEVVDAVQGVGVPPILFAFLAAVVFKTTQGSSATAMITTSAMLAPVVGQMTLGFHTVYLVMAIGAGSMMFSWMNDSGFWVVAKMANLTEAEALKTITPTWALMGVVSFVITLILSIVLPLV